MFPPAVNLPSPVTFFASHLNSTPTVKSTQPTPPKTPQTFTTPITPPTFIRLQPRSVSPSNLDTGNAAANGASGSGKPPSMLDNIRNAMARSIDKSKEQAPAAGVAQTVNFAILMPVRTAFIYASTKGTGPVETFSLLRQEGVEKFGRSWIQRFYKGGVAALTLSTVVRMQDVALNAGLKEFYSDSGLNEYPKFMTSLLTGGVIATGRTAWTPIDVVKGYLQRHGSLSTLPKKVHSVGPFNTFFAGAWPAWKTNTVSNTIWWGIFNQLDDKSKAYKSPDTPVQNYMISGSVGSAASAVEAIVTNPLRVLKNVKQTHNNVTTYEQAFQYLLAQNKSTAPNSASQLAPRGFLSQLKSIIPPLYNGFGVKFYGNLFQTFIFTGTWKTLQPLVNQWLGIESSKKKSYS